jgi:hypothetical protein
MLKLFALLFLILSASRLWAAECLTHQTCAADSVCSCYIPADSAYNRYYYIDISGLEKGYVYQCQFSDSLNLLTAVFEKSVFPEGSKWDVSSGIHFPVSATLDTHDMKNPADQMIIKYFVPGSDMTTELLAHCNKVS